MALIVNQPYETPHGYTVPSTYWRYVNFAVDVPALKARLVLYAYVDQAAYDGQRQPIGQKEYVTKTPEEFVAIAARLESGQEAISAVLYDHVKQQDPFFADATDTEQPPA